MLMIIDGHYQLHRMLHVPAIKDLRTSKGRYSGGVYGVLNSLHGSLYKFPNTTSVIVVWDYGRSRRRQEIYPEYKGNRTYNDEPEDGEPTYLEIFQQQRKLLSYILPFLGIRRVRIAGKEGDDLLGYISRARAARGEYVMVVTDDKDMLQLVSENVQVYRPIAKVQVTNDNFAEITGVPNPNLYMHMHALMGDGSDNISGIKGVGVGTISKILNAIHPHAVHVPGAVLEHCAENPTSRHKKIIEAESTYERNLKLVDLAAESFTADEERIIHESISEKNRFDIRKLQRFFTEMEFNTFLSELVRWVVPFQNLR